MTRSKSCQSSGQHFSAEESSARASGSKRSERTMRLPSCVANERDANVHRIGETEGGGEERVAPFTPSIRKLIFPLNSQSALMSLVA